MFDTDYKLFKWLEQNNFPEQAHEFTIFNEIKPTFEAGCPSYDECPIKGVMLPLKFQFKKVFEAHDNFR